MDMGWVASSESEFWWGSKTYKVTSHIIYNSLSQKVLFATKEDLIKRTASNDHFWMCGEVVARAARMGRKPLRYRG
jgi:hypothetical protein